MTASSGSNDHFARFEKSSSDERTTDQRPDFKFNTCRRSGTKSTYKFKKLANPEKDIGISHRKFKMATSEIISLLLSLLDNLTKSKRFNTSTPFATSKDFCPSLPSFLFTTLPYRNHG
jgi:hypothetical protein